MPSEGEATIDKERFVALWGRARTTGDAPDAEPVYDELLRLYSEPHRHYHTPAHIEHCLSQFEPARELMQEPDAVEMGIWFHDAVYRPGDPDNERESAELFLRRADGCFGRRFTRKVFAIVLATTHQAHPENLDEQFMVDIDLSGFGFDWEPFRQDSEAVRKEFAHLSDEQFYAAHSGFLRALLQRPTFYFTDFFRQRYERTARRNIERYLAELADDGLV